MKKIALILTLIASIFIQSCGDDDPVIEPDIIVGSWLLDGYYFRDLPPSHSLWEGQLFPPTALGGDSYQIVFSIDDTYIRTIAVPGQDVIDEGTFVKTDTRLVLISPDLDADDEFSIDNLDETTMSISKIFLITGIEPNIYIDSLANDPDYVVPEEAYTPVELRLEHFFERESSN